MSEKILLLSHKFYPSIGGIETITELLAHSFLQAGHEVHVLTWSTDETNKEFPFAVIRNPTLGTLLKEHAWASLVFENNPCFRLAWPSVLRKKPSVIVLQTWLPKVAEVKEISNRIKHWWLKRATKVVAISDAVRRQSWPAATVIGNSYNATDFTVTNDAQRKNDFVFVGRLVSDKGADLAIKALHAIITPATAYSLTIIGEGPDWEDLHKLVDELNLREHVRFTGSLRGSELAACLNQHRFLLVPSVWEEPFGIVALEGMACGCLPIVSNGGGLPDAIGKAGLLFRRGDVNSLTENMLEALNNPGLEQTFQEAAKEHLANHHPQAIVQRYLNIIHDISVPA